MWLPPAVRAKWSMPHYGAIVWHCKFAVLLIDTFCGFVTITFKYCTALTVYYVTWFVGIEIPKFDLFSLLGIVLQLCRLPLFFALLPTWHPEFYIVPHVFMFLLQSQQWLLETNLVNGTFSLNVFLILIPSCCLDCCRPRPVTGSWDVMRLNSP